MSIIQNAKILIVDDVVENTQILQAILQKEGYETYTTNNGYKALELVKEKDFSLILLDIMMPNISGLEVCRFLKIDPETANIPVIFLTASKDKALLTKAFSVGGIDYLIKPYFKEELLARVRSAIKMRHYEKNLEDEVSKRTQEMKDAQIYLMRMLGGVAEGHSVETYQHVKRVSEVSYLLAKKYGMDDNEAEMLKYASYLHDIGKIGIKDYILHKDGKLTDKEFDEIKKHPKIGSVMLKGVQLPLFKIAQIVSEQHHEKWDGSGYPKGLKEEEIHIYARIVALADVFDALSSKRSYKEGWSMRETLDFFKEESGKHFDPHLVYLFFEYLDEFLAIYGTSKEKIEQEKTKPKKKKNWILNLLSRER